MGTLDYPIYILGLFVAVLCAYFNPENLHLLFLC